MKKLNTKQQSGNAGEPHIVVLGGGFGGLEFCRRMKDAPVHITLVDRRNHHLFQPLLYQVATAGLSAPDIASSLRATLARQENIRVLMEEVAGIELEDRRVLTSSRSMDYDYLVIALGARTSFFGNDSWREHTLDLKSLDDAVAMRRVVLSAFEEAEGSDDAGEVRRLTTIAIVGGGPTGVELAGAFAELTREVLPGSFRRVDPGQARVVVIEASPRLLQAYSAGQSEYTRRRLEKMGVTVKTGSAVSEIGDGYLVAGGERIESASIIWAAGVEAPPLTRTLGVPVDKAGRLRVGRDLSLPGFPEVFAVGDIASVESPDGKPVPGVAPAAMQMGKHVAKLLRGETSDGSRSSPVSARAPFRYWDKGSMATIGRSSAVAEVAGVRFNGVVAWLAWLVIHLAFLVGIRNRLFVFLQWIYAYATYRRGARVITGMDRLPQRGPGAGAGAGERWAPGANLGTTDSLAAK